MKNYINIISAVLSAGVLMGCEGFLDERPNKSLSVPMTLDDLQQILDNSDDINITPALGFLASDDYYTTENGWNSYRTATEKNSYIWDIDIFEGDYSADWYDPYHQIFASNIVIETGQKLFEEKDDPEIRKVISSAKFFRAHAHFNLLQVFSLHYDPDSPDQLGVPISLSPAINKEIRRATVHEGYQQIIQDLLESVEWLPSTVVYKTRPSKDAVYGLLTRVYLARGEFEEVKKYAELAIDGNSRLLEYSNLNPSVSLPFAKYNDEVIFHSHMVQYGMLSNTQTFVDSLLINKYASGDLRKDLYFIKRGQGYNFRGQYSGNHRIFSGIALDELYLNYAEALIRSGEIENGLQKLNEMLITRFNPEDYMPVVAQSDGEALEKLLLERRKSLVFRGLNWIDLRRLNMEGRFQRTLVRQLGEAPFVLEPNSNRYVMPIPDDEIRMNGLTQNQRN